MGESSSRPQKGKASGPAPALVPPQEHTSEDEVRHSLDPSSDEEEEVSVMRLCREGQYTPSTSLFQGLSQLPPSSTMIWTPENGHSKTFRNYPQIISKAGDKHAELSFII